MRIYNIPKRHEESKTVENIKNMTSEEVIDGLAKIVSAYSEKKYGASCDKNTGEEVAVKRSVAQEKPKDWPFMEQSGEVLDMIPETWRQYPDDVPGRMSIIGMEFAELQNAKTREQKMHELVHLGSACLYLWRKLAHVE